MSTPSGQGHEGNHQGWEPTPAPIAPIPQQSGSGPGDRGRGSAASLMWAIATIVVAVVGGFLIYTAITADDGSGDGPGDAGADPAGQAPATVTVTQTAAPTGSDTLADPSAQGAPPAPTEAATAPTEGAAEPEPTTAAPTLSQEQREFLLGLARRDPDDPLAKGEVDAPVVIIEYADYRCPYCASWGREVQPALQDLIDDGTVRLEFRDRVLFGEDSEATALAARAAGEQGLFWEFHDAVFAAAPESGHPDMPREKLLGLAEEVGVPDLEQFEADLDSPELRAAMEADNAEAESIGVRSTPSFLVNTVALIGAQPEPAFRAAIAQELEKVQEGQ